MTVSKLQLFKVCGIIVDQIRNNSLNVVDYEYKMGKENIHTIDITYQGKMNKNLPWIPNIKDCEQEVIYNAQKKEDESKSHLIVKYMETKPDSSIPNE